MGKYQFSYYASNLSHKMPHHFAQINFRKKKKKLISLSNACLDPLACVFE